MIKSFLRGVAFALIIGTRSSPAADRPVPVDLWGNVYPQACQRADLLDTPAIILLDQHLGHWPDGRKTIGLFLQPMPPSKTGTILVDRTVQDKFVQMEVIRHEQCHNLLWRTTGDPDWHPE